jgi:hypothetical protein
MSPRLLLPLVLALAPCAAAADARLDWQREGACPVLFSSIEIAGPRLRFEMPAEPGEPFWSVFDGDEDLVTSVIPSQRAYMRLEVDADAADYSGDVVNSSVTYMDRQMAQARAQMEEMKKSCGRNCPQLPDMEAIMAMATGGRQPPIEARETADSGDANGVACAWREWVQAGQVVRRECLAEVAELPLADADRGGFARGMKVMVRYGDSFGAFRDRFGIAPEPQAPMGRLSVAQVCFAGGVESGRATMAITPATVDPARFEVPAGYRPVMGGGNAE